MISLPGDKKELLCGSLALLGLLNGFVERSRLCPVLASPEQARQ